MPTRRLLPPISVQAQRMTVNGRTYTATPGQVRDVPDFDSAILEANGWTPVAFSGPTSDRPKGDGAPAGKQFYDTDIGALIVFDGESWRDPSGSAR